MENNMNADELKMQANVLLDGLNGLIKSTERMAVKSFENISAEDAVKFSEALKNAGVDSKVKQMQKDFDSLKNSFNIL